MNRFDLVGKVAIVTGGDWGIGLGIARGLAIAGADIAVAARDAAKSAAACSELVALGVRAVALTVDLTDLGQVQAMAADTPQDLGRVDILVATARSYSWAERSATTREAI